MMRSRLYEVGTVYLPLLTGNSYLEAIFWDSKIGFCNYLLNLKLGPFTHAFTPTSS